MLLRELFWIILCTVLVICLLAVTTELLIISATRPETWEIYWFVDVSTGNFISFPYEVAHSATFSNGITIGRSYDCNNWISAVRSISTLTGLSAIIEDDVNARGSGRLIRSIVDEATIPDTLTYGLIPTLINDTPISLSARIS